jgi:hypothetical protein
MTNEQHRTTRWWVRSGIVAIVGVALMAGVLPTSAAVAPSLGAARSFAALAGSTLTNTGSTTTIDGNVGVSPGSAITGITESQVTGGIYVGGDAEADQAHSDAALAYAFLAGMASDANLTSTDLGGLTLEPGVYTFNSSAALTGALFLDAGGDSGAVFVFQVGTSFTASSGSSVTVINGGANYDPANIFWQVGSSATIGTTSQILGHIIADQSVTLETGASLTGNALALNGAVTLDSNSVNSPGFGAEPEEPVDTIEPPINLMAVLAGSQESPRGDLSWNDASDNETEFRVYRRDGSGPGFVRIGTVLSADAVGTGGVVLFSDNGVVFGRTYTYRVTAFEATLGESAPSNEALITTGSEPPVSPPIIAPIELVAVLNSEAVAPGADLTWNDASDNETEFRVYRRDGAGPEFVLVGTVQATDTPGIGGVVTFRDLLLDSSRTYAYRVTAFNSVDGESVPSNQALIDTLAGPRVRWLDVEMGRRPSRIVNHDRPGFDKVDIKGSWTVVDVEDEEPTVQHRLDPRIHGASIQVRGPGNLVLLVIPPGDPNWTVSKRNVYKWRSRDGNGGPRMFLRLNPRKAGFRFKATRIDFGSVPTNDVTVSLSLAGVTGSQFRTWTPLEEGPRPSKARFTLAR